VVVAPPKPPDGADFQRLVESGEDLGALEPHVVRGKVTIFDFYADWCGPCLKVDEHVFGLLGSRNDIAYRKLNIVSWESALAKHYMAGVPSLPFVVVYGRDGKPVGRMTGLQLDELDRAIAAGSRP
jgi:thiol-disulfide isomerase/thioredoxin